MTFGWRDQICCKLDLNARKCAPHALGWLLWQKIIRTPIKTHYRLDSGWFCVGSFVDWKRELNLANSHKALSFRFNDEFTKHTPRSQRWCHAVHFCVTNIKFHYSISRGFAPMLANFWINLSSVVCWLRVYLTDSSTLFQFCRKFEGKKLSDSIFFALGFPQTVCKNNRNFF